MSRPARTLSTADRIGVLGDTHGDLEHVRVVSETMSARGISVLLVLGDFGFIWPGRDWNNVLDQLSDQLSAKGQILYWLDGNHEDFRTLYDTFAVSEDGLRRIRANIIHLPRGYRALLASGKSLAVMGGANSVDKDHRREGSTWWPEEAITNEDLRVLGHQQVDILLGHDAPLHLPSLDEELARTDQYWSAEMRAYSAAGRRKFHEAFLQVRPRALCLSGHYHQFVDESVRYGQGAGEFETRVVILDRNSAHAYSQGILNVHTFELDVFVRDDTAVTELTGFEHGRWRIWTRHSSYVMDLDTMTVTRFPAEPAPTSTGRDRNRPTRRLDINQCRVGKIGYWTIQTDGWSDSTEYFWQVTTVIRRIEKEPNAKAH